MMLTEFVKQNSRLEDVNMLPGAGTPGSRLRLLASSALDVLYSERTDNIAP